MKKDKKSYNYTTRIISMVIGIILALSGIYPHGIYEILQGNNPTEGVYINSIGEEHIYWDDGTDPAITIVPNFLITGILAITFSLIIIIWSIFFVYRWKYSHIIFLALFIILTLFGGGIGFTIFYLITWIYTTRINKPLEWWSRVLSSKLRKVISKFWIPSLIITCLSFTIGNLISIYGYVPGVKDNDTIFNICWAFLITGLIFINITFIFGFASDIEKKLNNAF